MCQPMPTCLYTHWDVDSETIRFTYWQNKSRSFESTIKSYCQRSRPDLKIESFYSTGIQKKIDRFNVDGFVLIALLCLKRKVAFTNFIAVKSCVHLSKKNISNVSEKRELDEVRKRYVQEKSFTLIKK